jgi:hypothetical protein
MHVVASVGITPCSVASLFASCSLHYAKSDADRMQTAVGSVLQGCKHGRIVPKLGQNAWKIIGGDDAKMGMAFFWLDLCDVGLTFTLALGGLNRLPTSFLRSNLFAGRSCNKGCPRSRRIKLCITYRLRPKNSSVQLRQHHCLVNCASPSPGRGQSDMTQRKLY